MSENVGVKPDTVAKEEDRAKRYKVVHEAIAAALKDADAGAYVTGITTLASLMSEEAEEVATGSGDLRLSVGAWGRAMNTEFRSDGFGVQIESGGDVRFLSSTLTNQRTPHPEESPISRQVAEYVAEWVNARSGGYIQSGVERGGSIPQDSWGRKMSPARVATTVVGFKPSEVESSQSEPGELSTFKVDWDGAKIG